MKRMLCIVGGMNAGGAETFLMKVYRALDKSQYQMDFAVAIEDKGFYDDEILAMGGKIYHIIPKTKGFLKNFMDIRRIVKENNYKSVLRTSQHSLSALELLAARLGGAKKTIFRSSNSDTTTGNRLDQLLHRICMFMPRYFANIRIAPSTEAAEFMFGKNCIKKGVAQIVHNGIDFDYYKYDENARNVIRREFGIENCFVIGHVGRFNKQKNHNFLIDVFFELQKKRDDARLLLVGKGELEAEIRKKCESLDIIDKVIFTGVRSDLPSLYSAMDVFLFPSLYEGMPNALIEAQACGLPCIVSDTVTKEAIVGLNSKIQTLDVNLWLEELFSVPLVNRINQGVNDEKFAIQGVVNEIIFLFE